MAADDTAARGTCRTRVAAALAHLADAATPTAALGVNGTGGGGALRRVQRLLRPAAPLGRAGSTAALTAAGLLLLAPALVAVARAAAAGTMPDCRMSMTATTIGSAIAPAHTCHRPQHPPVRAMVTACGSYGRRSRCCRSPWSWSVWSLAAYGPGPAARLRPSTTRDCATQPTTRPYRSSGDRRKRFADVNSGRGVQPQAPSASCRDLELAESFAAAIAAACAVVGRW